MVTSCRGRVNTWVGKKEVQTIGCKVGYDDILHNRGNIANVCNNCKWSVTFKTYICIFPHSIYHCSSKNYSRILFDHRVISVIIVLLECLRKGIHPLGSILPSHNIAPRRYHIICSALEDTSIPHSVWGRNTKNTNPKVCSKVPG